MGLQLCPIALIKFAISNPSESKKFISTIRAEKFISIIWAERIFLSLTRVFGGGDLEGGDEAGASLALLLLLLSLLVGDLKGGDEAGASLAPLFLLLSDCFLALGNMHLSSHLSKVGWRWKKNFWFEI